MASRLGEKARKKKMAEEAAAQEGSVRRRAAVREQVEARPKKVSKKFKPAQDDIAESAPVSLSDAIKQTLNTGTTYNQKKPRRSLLDPPTDPQLPAGVGSATTYNPGTDTTKTQLITPDDVATSLTEQPPKPPITVSNPRESVPAAPTTFTDLPNVPMIQKFEYVYDPITKTRTKQMVSKPASLSAQQEQQIENAVKERVLKLSTETQEQYETRLARVISQDKDFALKGISVADRQKAISDEAAKFRAQEAKYTMTEEQRLETVRLREERAKLVESLGLDPNRKYSGSYLAEIEKRQNDPFTPVIEGLTWFADNVVANVIPLAGPLGGILAQAYKNFAPPTSKFYTEADFDDKVVNFLVSNVEDKAKDLLMGQLKGTVGFAKNLAKGYRRVDLKGGEGLAGAATGRLALQESATRIPGGRTFTEGVGNIRGPQAIGTRADFGDTRIGPLPATRAPQAPQRLQAQRTDVLISPRAARGAIARPARGTARPVARQ
jgi:hypothetical protein